VDIESLVTAWTCTWNSHDMRAAAALVDVDVDFVTVAGRWLRGRDEFLDHHVRIHRLQMRETVWATHAYETRPLRDNLALVHLEWMITGELDLEGLPRLSRRGTFTWIVAEPGHSALIVVAHNTNLRADTSHRLARP
jgi:uncharacterized protein (TIGR02246 family)